MPGLVLRQRAGHPRGATAVRAALAAPAHAHHRDDRRCLLTAGAADADAVGALLRQAEGVEPQDDVGRRVPGAGDAVEELVGDGADRDRAERRRVSRDHRAAFVGDLGDRVPAGDGVGGTGDVGGGVDDPRRAGAAGEHVSHRDGAGEGVEGGRGPAVVRRRGAGDEGLATDAPGDDDDGAGRERACDPERTVSDGGHVDVTEPECGRPVRHLARVKVGHGELHALVRGQGPQLAREAGRVERTRVGDDPDPAGTVPSGAVLAGTVPAGTARAETVQALADLYEGGALVPRTARRPLLGQIEHRLVREHVQREDVQGRRREELGGRAGTIGPRRGDVADA